jgi:superfamily I DNA and/or RNA helicase
MGTPRFTPEFKTEPSQRSSYTRAQKRIYIVGCKETWGSLPFFSDALKALESKPVVQANRTISLPNIQADTYSKVPSYG